MPESVVILLSDKRSGSTIFQTELCKHRDVQTVAYSPHTYQETHWWLMAAVLLNRAKRLYDGHRVYDGYGGRKNARTYMVDLLSQCVPDFVPPKDDKELAFSGWEALCDTFAKPVFFEKSPQHLTQWAALSLMLEWIHNTDRQVKVVGLVRNPNGVAYSAAKLFGTAPEERQFSWLGGCINLLAFEQMIPAKNYLRIRYDDLVSQPLETFGRVQAFIGVPVDSEIGSSVRSGSDEKWIHDEEYGLTLDPSVYQMATTLGFEAAQLIIADKPQRAFQNSSMRPTFKRRAALLVNRLRHKIVRPIKLRLRQRGQE